MNYIDLIIASAVALVVGWALRGFWLRWKASAPRRKAERAEALIKDLQSVRGGITADQAAEAARLAHLLGEIKAEAVKLPSE